ncbi:hypothetical protein MNV49_005204 [Pseudohyphozyma bogoriensis]|nr:hypothetical protein MNV49_005204 [Pseudohyphozyma bogoriensis]
MSIPSFKLNSGAEIPAIGLGTWQSPPGEVGKAVEAALKIGYRHIDGAWVYGNEAEVGQGIKASGVPREEIFLTSKLWCTFHSKVEEAVENSLKLLQTDYIDLYLIHWPVPLNPNGNDPKFPTTPDGARDLHAGWKIADTWKQMEAVLATGKVRAIGISNFSQAFVEDLLKTAKVTPAVNQIELHPYLPQIELVEWLQSKGITPQAYSPLGSTNSPLLSDPAILKIAEKHGAGAGNVLISYQVARGVVVLPKSVTPSRIADNFKVLPLDAEDVETLNKIHVGKIQRFVRPVWPIDLKFDKW